MPVAKKNWERYFPRAPKGKVAMVLNVSQGHSLVRGTLGLQDEARPSTGKRVMGIGTRLKFKVLDGPWKEGQNQVTLVI